jgi:hypothetical protein
MTDKFLSGCKRKDGDYEAGLSKDVEPSSREKWYVKNLDVENIVQDNLFYGFTNTDDVGEEGPQYFLHMKILAVDGMELKLKKAS